MDDLTAAVAAAHRFDLMREAGAHRLARLAACCRPAVLRERVAHLLSWLRHGQIGTGLDDMSAAPITARCSA